LQFTASERENAGEIARIRWHGQKDCVFTASHVRLNHPEGEGRVSHKEHRDHKEKDAGEAVVLRLSSAALAERGRVGTIL
jgi:hypothetical protein